MGWESYWRYYKPAKPKEVREGIKAKAYEVASGAALQKAVGESEEDAETKNATK